MGETINTTTSSFQNTIFNTDNNIRNISDNNIMSAPKVNWCEGMMIGPQHFQRQEFLFETTTYEHVKLLHFKHYGIISIEIDEISLSYGIVKVKFLEAVMPDGLIGVYSENRYKDSIPIECDITHYKDSAFPIVVNLCISSPKRHPDKDHPRYIQITDEITDFNSGFSVSAPCILPNLFLNINEIPPWATGFPILKIEYEDQMFKKRHFTPACFFVQKSSKIWNDCMNLTKKIREIIGHLIEKKEVFFGTQIFSEITQQLYIVNNALIGIEYVINGPPAHPHILYADLCRLLGILSFLKLESTPYVMAYEHSNLDKIFDNIIMLCNIYLNTLEKNYSIICFDKKDRLFYLYIHTAIAKNKIYIGIKRPQKISIGNIEDWAMDSIICSDFAIDDVRHKRITGLNRKFLDEATLQMISPGGNFIILEVEIDDRYFKSDQMLYVVNPTDTINNRPEQIVLFVSKYL